MNLMQLPDEQNSKRQDPEEKTSREYAKLILMKTNPRKKIAKDRKVIPDPIDDRKFQE